MFFQDLRELKSIEAAVFVDFELFWSLPASR
jgi:hypothetical protein